MSQMIVSASTEAYDHERRCGGDRDCGLFTLWDKLVQLGRYDMPLLETSDKPDSLM